MMSSPSKEVQAFVKELDKHIKDFGRYLPEYKLHHAKASQMIQKFIDAEVAKETQRMCDVAYGVYEDEGRYVGPEEAAGAYAVVEALGKEVK
jgi:hypothetical protein